MSSDDITTSEIASTDCRSNKHSSCTGDGWDMVSEITIPCPCSCHGGRL